MITDMIEKAMEHHKVIDDPTVERDFGDREVDELLR